MYKFRRLFNVDVELTTTTCRLLGGDLELAIPPKVQSYCYYQVQVIFSLARIMIHIFS